MVLPMTDEVWRGHWWLPDQADKQQPGTLTVTEEGLITLEIIGGFDLRTRVPLPSGKGYSTTMEDNPVPILHGRSKFTDITLIDCNTTGGDEPFDGPRWFHKMDVLRALIGVHLDDLDAPMFRKAYIRLENLFTWAQLRGLEHSFTIEGGREPTARILNPDPVSATVEDTHLEIVLRSGSFRFERQRDSATVIGDSTAVLTLTPTEPTSYQGLDDITKAIMDLLTLASDEASGIISRTLVLKSPRLLHRTPDDPDPIRADVEVELLGRHVHTSRPDEAPQEAYRFLFTCANKPFDELVSTWLPLWRRTRAVCSLLFGLKYARPTFAETRVLSAAVASEALHRSLYDRPAMPEKDFKDMLKAVLDAVNDDTRVWVRSRFRNEPSYKERLLDLAGRPAQEAVDFIIPDRDKWAKNLRDVRNGLAHTAGHDSTGIHKYDLAEVTTYLLYLVLMNELGLPAEIQLAAVQKNHYLAALHQNRNS